MKIFLSWSGDRSEKVANILRDWIPMVLQYVEPWLSSSDIPVGARWENEIGRILGEVDYGIICLTKENLNSMWLNYEAGAISKNERAKVIILLVDVDSVDTAGPLAQFQSIKAEKADLKKLIDELNKATERPLPEKLVDNIFENLYPNFDGRIQKILNEVNLNSETEEDGVSIYSLERKVDKIIDLLQNDKGVPSRAELIEKPKTSSFVEKPKIFIGSSSEGLSIAYAIQENLEEHGEVTIWNQGFFNLSDTVIESIVDAVYNFDFAIMIFTPDDILIKRGVQSVSPRDNIIFELGLFIGTLGRGRTFLVFDKDAKMHIPSDISGVTAATFSTRLDGNLLAALMPVCQRIKRAMGV